ncbi:uncharacterized protein TNCV_3930431 [Trichonephila clavipes]|nr:uncharacterized protein TNCV_3930431 [Trichonephila clavipes]
MSSTPAPLKIRRVRERCSSVILVTSPWFKITRSVANVSESLRQNKCKYIADISEALANASMKKAAAEEKIIDGTVNSVVVSGDGTWKTRGHTSLIGVCALIGADCGKVLDMEVMSSNCKGCDSYKGPKFGPKYSAFG